MSLEAGLYQLLATSPSLLALQGARVYPLILPETVTLPATTFQIVGSNSEPGFETSGPQRVRLQLDFFADYETGTYDQAVALRDATRDVLDGFTGELPNGFLVSSAWHLQRIDHFDSDARRYRCTAEYYIAFDLP